MTNIGLRIKQRREELGLTQQELADRMGYKSKSTINKVELGINDVNQSAVVKYAEALNTTIAYLMDWEEAEHSEENAHALGSVIHDAKLMDHVKKMLAMDDTKKEAVYSYTDFLLSNN